MVEYAVAAGLAVGAALVVVNLVNSDVALCRRTFAGLVKGDPAVRNAIAWDRFQAEEIDVGASYATLTDPRAQRSYQQTFIKAFSAGFAHEGGALGAFTRWRVEPDGAVAVDYPAKQKTLLFRLSSEAGRRQVVGLGWKQP